MDALAVKDWLAIIGLSSLIATIVGHLFSSAREHQRWVYENKRLEWRELVDRFHQILHNIHYYRSGSGKDINILGDLNEGMLLLRNRLFISEALEKWGVEKQWGILITNTMEPKRTFTPYEIIGESSDFENYLLDLARQDLRGGWSGFFKTNKPKPPLKQEPAGLEANSTK
jgi:hypothetical protein